MTAARHRSIGIRQIADEDSVGLASLRARPDVRARLGEVVSVPRDRWSVVRAIAVDGTFAGVVGLVQSDAGDGHDVELVAAVLPEHRGVGVASEACHLLLVADAPPRSHAQVLACVSAENAAAKALASRLGFRETPRIRPTGETIWVRPEADAPAEVVPRSVAVVVDPAFGERLASVAECSPVWIADTPINRAAAERCWESSATSREVDVTTFKVATGESSEGWCADILPTIALQ